MAQLLGGPQQVTYKLHYFNSRGRAEIARFLFVLAGKHYDDVRYASPRAGTSGLDFQTVKQSGLLPFGQLPALELARPGLKSTFLSQSHAIERYLAKELGLYGSNNLEAARIDEVCEGVLDIVVPYFTAHRNPNQSEKEAVLKTFWSETFPKFVAAFERFLKENEGNTFLVGKHATLGDVAVFGAIDMINNPDSVNAVLKNHPTVQANVAATHKLLEGWLSKRPVTSV